MDKHNYSKIIENARNAASNKEYDKATVLLSKIPKSQRLCCSELVFKASIIQLSNKQDIYSLIDAENALKEALNIDTDNIEALVEMGYYQLNVNDNAEEAKKLFKKAEDLCRYYLSEIEKGLGD